MLTVELLVMGHPTNRECECRRDEACSVGIVGGIKTRNAAQLAREIDRDPATADVTWPENFRPATGHGVVAKYSSGQVRMYHG